MQGRRAARIDCRTLCASAFLGVALSLSLFGRALLAAYAAESGRVFTWAEVAVGAIVIGVVCYALLRVLPTERFASLAGWARKLFRLRPANVVAVAAVMVVVWIPVIVLMMPFHIGPDTIAQLLWSQGYQAFDPSSRQPLEGYAMSDHHPVTTTLLYGLLYNIGQALGDAAWGMTLLCFVQIALMAVTFSYACCWMMERGVPALLCVVAFAFWALNPIFPMLLMQVVKDITSMPFFVAWVLCFSDCVLLVRAGQRITPGRAAALAVLGAVCALTRKTLLYIVAPSLLVLLLFALIARYKRSSVGSRGETDDAGASHRPTMRRTFAPLLVAAFIPALVMMVLVPRVLLPALNAAPGGSQEALAVPIQQVACVAVKHGDELSDSQREAISAVLPYDRLPMLYTPAIADNVKDAWNRASSKSDMLAFLRTWVELGIRYPGEYLGACEYLNSYWLVGSYDNDNPVIWWGWPEYDGAELFPQWEMSEQTEGQAFLVDVVRDTLWAGNPVTELLFDDAVYVLWVPLFAFVLALTLRRRQGNLIMFIPVALSAAVLFLVPAAQPRYAFNLVFLAPLIVSFGFACLPAKVVGNAATLAAPVDESEETDG